ncbi:UBA/THIF-type NAD/FAD binding protein [Cupriavidus necator]|uniref:UBA/THIF-type NAD/FAD binding protein n=1 Tax=Cupriavidus necator TaxID=106590 RepID=A0A1K0IGB0_CUPNE|nr:UBA/THIF-type NAD/FAD binding protein [Cupriavidus necator]
MPASAFESARDAVAIWLNGDGAAFARKVRTGADSHRLSWEVDLRGGHPIVSSFRISLPRCFPAQPCELHVDKHLCLVLPHVEEDGRVCLGSSAPPASYENGAWAVNEALKRFKTEFLDRIVDPIWVKKEFQEERLSYWSRYCERSQLTAPSAPRTTWLSLCGADALRQQGWLECASAVYAEPGKQQRRYGLQLVSTGKEDPNELAQRHRWATGTLVRGNALIVALPPDTHWTPSTWPADFAALEVLVLESTGGIIRLGTWINQLGWAMTGAKQVQKPVSRKRQVQGDEVPMGYSPRLVVVLDGPFAFGFQISRARCLSEQPQLTPLKISRVDRDWALSRDHQLSTLDTRRTKRVLLLGCGSLGSPVAELIARAGIGALDIVDFEAFEAPNVARHSLGLTSLSKSKAAEMAARIQKEVPECAVSGFVAAAAPWLARFRSEDYDLVIDCTGESCVRTMLAAVRSDLIGAAPIVHAWIEPFCAAAHVVVSPWNVPWPAADPADALINAADFAPGTAKVTLPACNDGFHPYGAADVMQAAAFAAERIIGLLDARNADAVVYSWVRAKAFFDALGVPVQIRGIVPAEGGKFSAIMMERSLEKLLAA